MLRRWVSNLRDWQAWRRRGWAAPSPDFIKRDVLLRHGWADATWVETGTYRGDTTARLAAAARRVISLEPAESLYRAALQRFAGMPQVELINATSEQAFPTLLPGLEGGVCFWLDGHFSGGPTYRGPSDTPILLELSTIGEHLQRWPRAVVLVDDLRLFADATGTGGPYPARSALVDWATQHGLAWHIEHDIFVARKG